MKAKNPTPEIMVRFKGAGQTRVFHPSDTISGIIEINPSRNINCRAIVIRIGWHTEGRGTRNEGYLYNNRIDHNGQLNIGDTIVEEFDFVIPPEPWSYSGQLISIVWAVEVQLDVPMGFDIKHEENFVVQP